MSYREPRTQEARDSEKLSYGITVCIWQSSCFFFAKMPARCVVAGCSNFPDDERCIALHPIPFSSNETSEGKKRRKRWVDFVKLKRAKWAPTKWSCICSKHFTPESFTKRYPATHPHPRLLRDEIGVVSYPTVQLLVSEGASPWKREASQSKMSRPLSAWSRKRVSDKVSF